MKNIMWPKYSDNIEQRATYRHEFSAKLILKHHPKRVLDVGCGSGALLSFLPKRVFGVGIENTERRAAISLQNGFYAVVVADASKLPFENAIFDVVSMLEVLEHIPKNEVEVCLREIYNVMDSDATLVVSVPFGSWISRIADPAWILGHRHYSELELRELLRFSGLMVKKMQIKGGAWELIGMLNLYICKWIFGRAMVGRSFFERKRRCEYDMNKQGFATLFAIAKRQ